MKAINNENLRLAILHILVIVLVSLAGFLAVLVAKEISAVVLSKEPSQMFLVIVLLMVIFSLKKLLNGFQGNNSVFIWPLILFCDAEYFFLVFLKMRSIIPIIGFAATILLIVFLSNLCGNNLVTSLINLKERLTEAKLKKQSAKETKRKEKPHPEGGRFAKFRIIRSKKFKETVQN